MGFSFNKADHTPSKGGDFAPLPDGWYTCQCDKVELKNSKSSDGQYLNFQWRVIGEDYRNRVIFDMVMVHGSADAVRIGKDTLWTICEAAGIDGFKDTSELVGITVDVRVTVEKGKGDWPDRNRIRKFQPAKTGQAPPPGFMTDDDVPF